MLRQLTLPMLIMAAASSALAGKPVIFTNEEQVYFDREAGRKVPPWVGMVVTLTTDKTNGVPYTISFVDAYGKLSSPPTHFEDASGQIGAQPDRDSLQLTLGNERIELRRARPVSCWVAIRKKVPKANGSEDWHFIRNVKLHDQGGRALVGADLADAEPVVIRVRNVTWDKGSTNHPVVTLYVHKPDKPDRAESYSWAAPDSSRIGINLRWMQAGCTIGSGAIASALTKDTFRQ